MYKISRDADFVHAKEILMNSFQNKRWYLGMAVIVLLAFASCDNGDGGDDTIVYKSDKGDTSYVLEITKNTSKAAFVPGAGDSYKLTVTKAGEAPQVSSGKVESYTNGVFTMSHSSGKTFTITGTEDGLMKEIKGNIPIDNSSNNGEETLPAPGVVDVNLEGTTWKGELTQVMEDGSEVNGTIELTFAATTLSVVSKWENSEEEKGSGTYTVRGTTVTIKSDSDDFNITLEVINGNSFYILVDGTQGWFYKQ
jgi:hypothetical protein